MRTTGKITIGDVTFKTQVALEGHVRKLINTIGQCNSIKEHSTDTYNFLCNLFMRHPTCTEKMNHMIDICVKLNKFKNGYEFYIIRSNGDHEDISWRKCVTGKGDTCITKLKIAMRVAVEPQIIKYKADNETMISKCPECPNSDGPFEVDHIKHFEQLVEEFLNTHNSLSIPTDFEDTTDGTNRKQFKSCDKEFETMWYNYHEKHATLRMLCKKCNASRPKYKKVVIGMI